MNLESKAILLRKDGIYTLTGSGEKEKISEDFFHCDLHNCWLTKQSCDIRRNLKPEQIDYNQLSHRCEHCKNGMALPYRQTRCTKLRTCRNCGPLPSSAFRAGTSGTNHGLCKKCLIVSESKRAKNDELRRQLRPCRKCGVPKGPDEFRTLFVCKQCYSDQRNTAQKLARAREKAGLARPIKRRGKYA